jgi:hypothetical protein
MSLEGTAINGVIVLDGGARLPEGTRIKVIAAPQTPSEQPSLPALAELAGGLDELPPDLAAEHDHYLHGTPRKNPELQ